jgi:hypothetical protein
LNVKPIINSLSKDKREEPSWLPIIRHQVQALRFSGVQVVVRESMAVPIERTGSLRIRQLRPGSVLTPCVARGSHHGVSADFFFQTKKKVDAPGLYHLL